MAGPANFLLQQIAQGAQFDGADRMYRGAEQGANMLANIQQQQDRNALAQVAQAYGQGGPQAARDAAARLGQYQATVAADNTLYGRGRDQVGDQRDARNFDYRQQRDQVGDSQWQQQFSANQDWRNWQRQNASQAKDPMAAFQTRAQAAEMLGLRSGTPEHQSYVLTGQLPRPGQGTKPTVDSSKAAGFYIRMQDAEKVLSDPQVVGSVSSSGAGRWNRIANEGVAPLGPLGPTLTVPKEYQDQNYLKFDQARRDFVNAILRRESGAVISDQEFENAAKQYFPEPGDPPALIEQKRQNRLNAIQGIQMAAEPSLKDVQGGISVDAMGGDGGWVDMGNGVRMRRKGQ